MGGSESSLRKRGGWLKKKAPPDKQMDLTRSIRDYLESLNREQLTYLASTYATLSTERTYYTASMKSRPLPPTIYQDFSDLLDYKYNSDVEIQLPAANFLAHKPLLMQRSGYFQAHLKGGNVKLSILNVLGFSEVLRWIYGGEGAGAVAGNEAGNHMAPPSLPGFLHLSPSPLPSSLLQLYTTRRYADCLLIWSSQLSQPAHVCVLSARSPLLRTLLSKKKQLVLDSNVIPYKYSNCLLYFMYTDELDLTLVEGEDIISHLEELFYCGQFLELDALTYQIESLLEEQINNSTYIRILKWANESFGSKYVKRCCLLFMEEYWFHLIQGSEYYSIPLECLADIAQSDFTQCPESELVDSLLRWAQYNSTPLPHSILASLRLDYITNTALLKQVTRGMKPSLLMQSRPRYWGPIHRQLVEMVGDGENLEILEEGAVGGNVEEEVSDRGEEILIDPDLYSQLLQKYDQLQQESTSNTDNISHWLRLQAMRECGLPDSYEKCLISTSTSNHQPQEPHPSPPSVSHHQPTMEHPLPDIASNIIDPIINLDLGDRFKH